MTGVSELRNVKMVSAAPETIRVSVLGGHTQLDIALPADVPVATCLPELARLIDSRAARGDGDISDRGERRTFWVLSRVHSDVTLAPDDTLRGAGVTNGELLRISTQRALSPPTLYDDVVDAAARLNRAAHAAWGPTAAGVMAFVGIWLCTAVWAFFLVDDALAAHRKALVGGAVLLIVTLTVGAALAHRVLRRTDIAAVAGWPIITVSAAVGWAVATRYNDFGPAVACAVLCVLSAVYFQMIGTGQWPYVAAAVVFGFGVPALLGNAVGARAEVVAAVGATVAALGAVATPGLTERLGRLTSRAVEVDAERGDHSFSNPGSTVDETSSGVSIPSAEEVRARVRSVSLTRVGLLAGLAAVVVVGASVPLRNDPGWPAFLFALSCAAILALRSRRGPTLGERAALAAPATALLVIACVHAQAGAEPLRFGGIGVLVAVALVAAVAGVLGAGDRLPGWVSSVTGGLEYVTVAGLIPLLLWVLGVYDGLRT